MASMWHKAMVYLGLGPDDEYEQFDTEGERRSAPTGPAVASRDQSVVAARPAGPTRGAPAQRGPSASARGAESPDGGRQRQRSTSAPRSPERPPAPPVQRDEVSAVRPLPPPGKPEAPPTKQRTVVRPVPVATTAKPHVVSPSSFNSAQDVADKFKAGQPVVLNLQNAERDLARRLIDFSSGLCYGLGGNMEKVGQQAYLLTPTNVEIAAEDRRRLSGRS